MTDKKQEFMQAAQELKDAARKMADLVGAKAGTIQIHLHNAKEGTYGALNREEATALFDALTEFGAKEYIGGRETGKNLYGDRYYHQMHHEIHGPEFHFEHTYKKTKEEEIAELERQLASLKNPPQEAEASDEEGDEE